MTMTSNRIVFILLALILISGDFFGSVCLVSPFKKVAFPVRPKFVDCCAPEGCTAHCARLGLAAAGRRANGQFATCTWPNDLQ
jgi:hypothetical protein